MAITLDSMVINTALNPQPRVADSIRADQATGAFDLADKRIGQQVSATNVQLSAFGQIKSSFADIQAAARSLSAPGKTSTTEDMTKAVQAFAEAFNNAAKAINAGLTGNGKSASVLADNGRANLATFDLRKILTNGNNASDLKRIGISVNQDGTLSFDTEALQSASQADPNAFLNTLARIGAQAEQVVGKELAGNGNIGGSVNALSARARDMETRAAEQKPATDSQNIVRQQTVNPGSNTGITAYRQMFSR